MCSDKFSVEISINLHFYITNAISIIKRPPPPAFLEGGFRPQNLYSAQWGTSIPQTSRVWSNKFIKLNCGVMRETGRQRGGPWMQKRRRTMTGTRLQVSDCSRRRRSLLGGRTSSVVDRSRSIRTNCRMTVCSGRQRRRPVMVLFGDSSVTFRL